MSVKPVGDAGSAPGGDDAVTEAVVKRFQELRGREQTLLSQISELEAQEVEHRVVVDALRPMDATRKCFHLVGGVLCERTVADVMPVIQSNKEGIAQVIKNLQEQLKNANEERLMLQKKHNIRVVTREQAARLAAEQQAAKASAAGGASA